MTLDQIKEALQNATSLHTTAESYEEDDVSSSLPPPSQVVDGETLDLLLSLVGNGATPATNDESGGLSANKSNMADEQLTLHQFQVNPANYPPIIKHGGRATDAPSVPLNIGGTEAPSVLLGTSEGCIDALCEMFCDPNAKGYDSTSKKEPPCVPRTLLRMLTWTQRLTELVYWIPVQELICLIMSR